MLLKQFNSLIIFLFLSLILLSGFGNMIAKAENTLYDEITPAQLIKRISNPIVEGSQSHLNSDRTYSNTYGDRFISFTIDIKKKTIFSSSMKKSEKVKFEYEIQKGSFLNKNADEILFIISFQSSLCGRAINDGISLKYFFDKDLNQIEEPILQDYGYRINEIKDIDDNGYSEVYFTLDAIAQGYVFQSVDVMERNFEKPILRFVTGYYQNGASDFLQKSDYTFYNNSIVLTTQVNIYRKGVFKKSKYGTDEYKLVDRHFIHIEKPNDMEWDDIDSIKPEF